MGMTERSEPSDCEAQGSRALFLEIESAKKKKKKKVVRFKYFIMVPNVFVAMWRCAWIKGRRGYNIYTHIQRDQ